ncbi:MAG: hypothetical protein DDT31_00234 [Syntrophomonadaceae bacterium]|nr:hypothetical protein [Bacillota bacterium]
MAAYGRFIPKNPAKVVGNVNTIMWRSSWELHFMKYLDTNQAIIRWGSEELMIPYCKPTDGKMHRYFPDMIVMYKHIDGSIRKEIVEIKPYKETIHTKNASERDKLALLVNDAKWKAAAAFAEQHGAIFRVITEKTLWPGINKRRPPAIGKSV